MAREAAGLWPGQARSIWWVLCWYKGNVHCSFPPPLSSLFCSSHFCTCQSGPRACLDKAEYIPCACYFTLRYWAHTWITLQPCLSFVSYWSLGPLHRLFGLGYSGTHFSFTQGYSRSGGKYTFPCVSFFRVEQIMIRLVSQRLRDRGFYPNAENWYIIVASLNLLISKIRYVIWLFFTDFWWVVLWSRLLSYLNLLEEKSYISNSCL